MTIPGSIGRHELRRQGDLLMLDFHGPLTLPDLQGLRAALAEVNAETGRSFLVADLNEATTVDSEARKYMAEWSRQRTDWVAGIAVHGIGFAMRTLLTLTLNAIKIVGAQQVEVVILRDEAEAIRWVDAKRLALYPETAPSRA